MNLGNQTRENLCEKARFRAKMPRSLEENPKELLGKLFYVWRKTQVRLSSNVLAFLENAFLGLLRGESG